MITPLLLALLLGVFMGAPAFAEPANFDDMLFVDLEGQVFAASSELEPPDFGELGPYGPHQLFDGNTYTGWSEGVEGPGIGEVLWVRVAHNTDTLLLVNGFARTPELFRKNNRVAEIEVELYHGYFPEGMVSEIGPVYFVEPLGESTVVTPEDRIEAQRLPLRLDWSSIPRIESYWNRTYQELSGALGIPPKAEDHSFFLRLEIRDTYEGSTWDDTCLTEVRAYNSSYFRPRRVYEDDGVIRYDTNDATGRVLARSQDRLYQLIDTDPRRRWILVFSVPTEAEGRIEGGYLLFNLPQPTPVTIPAVETAVRSGVQPTGFARGASRPTLLLDDGTDIALPAFR